MTTFKDLFVDTKKPVIACIHLPALPGSPMYDGNMQAIYEKALEEAYIFERLGIKLSFIILCTCGCLIFKILAISVVDFLSTQYSLCIYSFKYRLDTIFNVCL